MPVFKKTLSTMEEGFFFHNIFLQTFQGERT